MNVAIIDLGIGNIRSLVSAFSYLGVSCNVVSDSDSIKNASHLILPGVGAFDHAMQRIFDLKLDQEITDHVLKRGRPILGICLGMQLLTQGSEEGVFPGLSLVNGRCVKLDSDVGKGYKVPHVGFDSVYGYEERGLFSNLGARADYYFTHSYALQEFDSHTNIALCEHVDKFVAAFQKNVVCGVQFHPEKSQSTGLKLLSNFIDAC